MLAFLKQQGLTPARKYQFVILLLAGNDCDLDDDGDGIMDVGGSGPDNCRLVPNPDQRDTNGKKHCVMVG